MATTVPTTATSIPAELKGEAGSGLATTQTQQAPVSLSPALKEEIKKVVGKYAANKASLTTTEFLTFLKQEQHTSEVPFEGDVSTEKLEEYLISPVNVAVQVEEQDLSHPLKDYLISTSHNTYLVGNQLYGDASCEGYKTVLLKGCRCIEIDCWDGESDEPKVVHGFTAVEPITFRNVCKAIAQYAFVTSDLPVIISLEVHCSLEQQKKMIDILEEEFGDMLLKSRVEGLDLETLPSPMHLKNKILLKSKYLPPATEQAELSALSKEPSASSVSSSEEDDDFDPLTHIISGNKKRSDKPPKVKTLRALSELGIYTTSTHYRSFSNPLSKLFNHIHSFSERRFKKLLEERGTELKEHNSKYLTRVYPFGLRFTSSNEEPAIFWRHGAQLVALNWQKFDLGMMQNEALFGGSGGMVLKPKYIHSPPPQPVYLTIDIIGASGLPCPEGVKDIRKLNPYVKVELRSGETEKKETKRMKDTGADVIWNDTLAFHRVWDNLAFVRFMIYHDEIGRDKMFAVYTARLDALQQGYRFLRLLDVEGKQIPGAVLLIRVRKN